MDTEINFWLALVLWASGVFAGYWTGRATEARLMLRQLEADLDEQEEG